MNNDVLTTTKAAKNDSSLPKELLLLHTATEVKDLIGMFRFPELGDGDGAPMAQALATTIVCSRVDATTKEIVPGEFSTYPLRDLRAIQLRTLGQLLQLRNSSLKKRDDALLAILHRVSHDVDTLSTYVNRKTASKLTNQTMSSILVNRLTTVLFSDEFRDNFSALNNAKSQADIELVFYRNNQTFYEDVTNEVNCDLEGFHSLEWLPAPEDFINGDKYIMYLFKGDGESHNRGELRPRRFSLS